MFKCKRLQQQKPIVDCEVAETGLPISHILYFLNYTKELIVKYDAGLKSLLQQGISEAVFNLRFR